jgi:predicted dehydrogenase
MTKEPSRRSFIGALGAGMAAPYFLTSNALGAEGDIPASDRLRIGHIGINWMGGIHLDSYASGKAYPEARSVAACDVDADHLAKAAKRIGEHCKTYHDFRDLLDDKDIDAVVVATPDHWHAIVCIQAAEAGKDIYCEKPLSLTIREARAMANAVRRYGRVFQTGSQQRSEDNFRYACELVRSGRIGKVRTVHVGVGGPSGPCDLPEEPVKPGLDWNFWLGPAPWRPYNGKIHPVNWRSFMDYSGGGMTDWGAHHFDIAQWGLGMDASGPVEVHPPDGKDYASLTYKYANGVVMFHGGANGVLFTGTDGKIEVNRGYLKSWPEDIVKVPIGASDVHLYKTPPSSWRGHTLDWMSCIRSRRRPICDVEVGCRSITVCHLGNLAWWLKRPLKWDPRKEEIIGDKEAARWLDRPKRAPWHL